MKEISLREEELDRLLVIKEVQGRKLSQREAGVRLGLTPRQIRRLVIRVKVQGALGIKPQRRGGNRSFREGFKEEVLCVIRSKYHGFGPTFASEKLFEEGIKVNKETLRQWMIGATLWKGRSRKVARIHQSRLRRPQFGELVQIDGSHHDWFEGRAAKCCLFVFIDDATSKLIGLLFKEIETTLGYMTLVKRHVQAHGRPLAYYSDKHSIFKTTREDSIDGRYEDTQLHRALRSLQIELICAHSPQAKGRVERANQTLQDRLVKELRLRGISSIEEANAYLPEFMKAYNERFSIEPKSPEDAHRPLLQDGASLSQILSIHTTRKLSKNLEFSLNCTLYQITTPAMGYRLRHRQVTVCEHLDGTLEIMAGQQALAFKTMPGKKAVPEVDRKELDFLMDQLIVTSGSYPQGSQISLPA